MQATEREIPIFYGSDLIQTASGHNNHTWTFPGPLTGSPEQKAPYFLVIELDSSSADRLKPVLESLNKGRDRKNVVQVALVASGDTHKAREFVNETLKDKGVGDLVNFVIWDDIDRTKEQPSLLEVFWPLYQGEDKGQKKLFIGTSSRHKSYGASKIGMPALTSSLKDVQTADGYFHRRTHPLIDGKPDYTAPEQCEQMGAGRSALSSSQRGLIIEAGKYEVPSQELLGNDIVIAIEPKSKRAFPWFSSTYFPTLFNLFSADNPFNDDRQDNVWFFLKVTLLRAFAFDGYNIATNEITSADGQTQPYRSEKLPLGLMLASFFGLPTRVESVMSGVPSLSGWQLWRNFWGGWNLFSKPGTYGHSETRKRFEKRGWEIAAVPFKLFIIFPLKIVLIPFKTAINILKLFTEILPALLNYGLLYLIGYSFTLVDGVYGAGNRIQYKAAFYGVEFLRYMALFLAAVVVLSLAAVQYATMLLNRVGFALTSPGRSAELAFALGRSVKFTLLGQTFGTILSYVFGVIGTLLSLALSAVLWTMLLPLALGAIGTVIPSMTSAVTWVSQLPFVTATLSWFSTFPLVSSSVILVNQFFATVGAALVAAFGPAVTTLATLTMVQVPAAVLVVGTTLGLLVPPVAAMLSIVADKLSDFWARWMWTPGGPFTSFFGACIAEKNAYVPLREMSETGPSHLPTAVPGSGVKKVVEKSENSLVSADQSVLSTGRAAESALKQPSQVQSALCGEGPTSASVDGLQQSGGFAGYGVSETFWKK